MSVLGTGPKWRSGHRSGAVRVCPGGMRDGSTPSGMRLLLKSRATSGEYRKRRVYSHFSALCKLCGPVAQLGARVNRTHEVRGSNPLGSTTTTSGIHQAPVPGFAGRRGLRARCIAISVVTTDRVTISERLPVSGRDEYGAPRNP